MVKKLFLIICCLLTLTANATLITQTHDITLEGEGTVGYTYFEVTTSGLFDIYSKATTLDAEMYLFIDDGNLDIADFVAYNDDSCPVTLCGASSVGINALIESVSLQTGFYVLAISDNKFTQAEAIAGLNNGHGSQIGLAPIFIDVSILDTSGASARLTPVSEPVSIALFGLAFIGLFNRKRFQ